MTYTSLTDSQPTKQMNKNFYYEDEEGIYAQREPMRKSNEDDKPSQGKKPRKGLDRKKERDRKRDYE